MKRLLIVAALTFINFQLSLFGAVDVGNDDLSEKVDTRLGTDWGRGSCLVGPCVPHGSVYPSPDGEWPAPGRKFPPPSGWYPGDRVIGFSQLHTQGTGGVPSYGIFRVVFGPPSKLEIVESHPYRFRARLTDIGVEVAISATAHGAVYEYSGREPIIDYRCKIGLLSATSNAMIKVEGSVISGGGTYFGNWNPAPYDCWFYATKESGRLRIAVSFKSIEQAKIYHDAELSGKTLDEIAAAAKRAWNDRLSSVMVAGLDDAGERAFYTHLFHAFVQPRDRVSDGIGWDDHYTLWDTWKTLFPLLSLIDPATVAGNINSFADRFEKSGRCDTCYTQGREYKVGQGGDEADCVIADAAAKNIRGIDWDRVKPLLIARLNGRTQSYRERGFVADGERDGYCWRMFSGSGTLSFAYQDWCVGKTLERLNGYANQPASEFLSRSMNWTNVWNSTCVDSESGIAGFVGGRTKSGKFLDHPPRKGYNKSFYEAIGWEYSFFAPHDIEGLIARCGGKRSFVNRLEYALSNGLIDFSNEPSFLTPWLFTFADRPDLSSKWAHEVLKLFPESGCPGDDDSGAMGSFYVFLTAGLMPVAGQDIYLLHAPAAEEIVIKLPDSERTFTIRARGASRGKWRYDSVSLNSRRLKCPILRHKDILAGGELVFENCMEAQHK